MANLRPKRVDKRRGRQRNLSKVTVKQLDRSTKQVRQTQNKVGKVEFVSSKGVERNRQVFFKFEVRAMTPGMAKYAVSINFNKVEFQDERTRLTPLTVALGSGENKYIQTLDDTANPVAVRCTCKDFRFTWGWADDKHKSLSGPNNFQYTRKTPPPPEGYPYRNPDDKPGYCKHIRACLDFLKRNKVLR